CEHRVYNSADNPVNKWLSLCLSSRRGPTSETDVTLETTENLFLIGGMNKENELFMADASKRGSLSERRARLSNMVSGLGKLPPQAVDLEEAVLGALMLEKNALSSVIDILKPETFYSEAHQKIFEAIHNLFQKTSPVDLLTVTAELRQMGALEMVGGAYYITQL